MNEGNSSAGSWTGRWCWTKKHLSRPWNTYTYFRRAFDLSSKPRSAIIRISADARYVLYVNGQRIHQGPARCDPQFQSFDTLDIADALVTGRNVIGAIVHQFGAPTFQNIYRDASGFLFDGVIEQGSGNGREGNWRPPPTDRPRPGSGNGDGPRPDGAAIPLHTPSGWLCREAKGWRKDVARLSIQLGFQEHFDADVDWPYWCTPGHEAAADQWTIPVDLGPVGTHPWLKLEPRGVPLLKHQLTPFQSIIAQFSGENARGYKIAEDVYHLCAAEPRKREKDVLEEPDAMLRDDQHITTIPPSQDNRFAMVVLDLGQPRTGHIVLDIIEAAGDEMIDIIYTEEIDKNGPVIIGGLGGADKPTFSEEATADRYRCRAGAQRWESFHYIGFRYATLIFRNLEKPLRIRHVGLRTVGAALEDVGAFECSDDLLNRIWLAGRHTLRNCLFDAYVDCPWREQAQWWGDARVQFLVNAYTFGDYSLLERGIRGVARSQAPDGSLHAHPPSDCPRHRLPDFMLTWIGTLWDHYFHTGKTELLRECLPALRKLLDFFAAHESKNGLIGGFDGFWVFLDWAATPQDLYKSDFSGVLNLMYLQALRWSAAICDVLSEPALAAQYATKATAVATAVVKHFWDPKARCWRDGYDPARSALIESTSQHMHALAILLRLKPETHAALARDMLLKPAKSGRGKTITASPFFYAYILEALFESGLRAEAIEIIHTKWAPLLEHGTFPEVWEPTSHSRCHAWSSSPVYHLSQQVLGVMPVDVGWRQIRIAPTPGGKLDFVRGRVPSPLGVITTEWEKSTDDQLAVRIELPNGMHGEFVDPLGTIRELGPGMHQFHT